MDIVVVVDDTGSADAGADADAPGAPDVGAPSANAGADADAPGAPDVGPSANAGASGFM